MLPASYTDLIRYDGAAVQRDRRDQTVPCAIQPRDVEILADIWRYKFLTATQLLELHWPDCAPRVGRKRLTKLFHACLVERFRPVTRTGGSFPWTYHLGHDGHRLLRRTGALDRHARFELRTIYDYRYVLHEIHLNAWILAWRRLLDAGAVQARDLEGRHGDRVRWGQAIPVHIVAPQQQPLAAAILCKIERQKISRRIVRRWQFVAIQAGRRQRAECRSRLVATHGRGGALEQAGAPDGARARTEIVAIDGVEQHRGEVVPVRP